MRKGNVRNNALLYLAVLVFICLSAFLGGGVKALASSNYDQVILSDRAGLLEGTQTTALLVNARELAQKTGWDIRIVSTDDAGGRSAERYAEDFFMDHYRIDNGVVFLIDMDNRELFISTSGDAIYYLTDERLDSILDTAYEYVSEERYADVFRAMINQTSEYYSRGIDEQQYTFDRDTGKIVYYREPKRISLLEGILAAAAGLLSALGLGGAVKSKYNMKSGKYSYSLAGNSDLRLSNRQDVFVRKFVSSRNIPKNPPSSGGRSSGGYSRPHRSTIHTGSGGHTFGGRGRKF